MQNHGLVVLSRQPAMRSTALAAYSAVSEALPFNELITAGGHGAIGLVGSAF